MSDAPLQDLAATLGADTEQLRRLLKQTITGLPHSRYYVFRIRSDQRASTPSPERPRMITAFPTADAALGFAQRNYGQSPQIRAIPATELITIMLADATIGALLFLTDATGEVEAGRFGPGIKVNRSDLLARLHAPVAEPSQPAEASPNLSAAQYDALQFGVDFTDRAEFRVALAQAVETVVTQYEPPPGSVDQGPRSIFATSAVELWLRTHGFPHAHQRQWIDVADDPQWGGAVELCEIDGGTQNRLLIQLLIHRDDNGRQFIGRVNVTP